MVILKFCISIEKMKIVTKIYYYFLLCRPKTLIIGLCSVLIASNFNNYDNSHFLFPEWLLILLCYGTVLVCQISSNVINDYLDCLKGIDTQSRKGPKRILQQNLLSKKEVFIFYLVTVFITLILGVFLCIATQKPYFIFFLLIGILFAFLYSGGPFPLSHYAIGELAAFFFFGPFVVINVYYLLNDRITTEIFLLSCIPGSLSAIIMLLNNYRDSEQDQKANKITIVNFSNHFFFRRISPILLYCFFFIIILLLSYFLTLNFIFLFLFFPLPLFLLLMIKKKITPLFLLTLLWGITIHLLVI